MQLVQAPGKNSIFALLAPLMIAAVLWCSPAAAEEAGPVAAVGTGVESESGSSSWDRMKQTWKEVNKTVADTIGPLELGLSLTGYYGWHDKTTIADETYRSLDGTAGIASFTFNWQPIESGSLSGEFRYGGGYGSTKKLADDGATLGLVNEFVGDTTNKHVTVHSLFYQQNLFDGGMFIALGKSEPEAFIDVNSYANDEFGQFVDQAFVADPVLDNEDEQMPMVAVGGELAENLQAQAVVLASTQEGTKDEFDEPLETPFVGAQLAYSLDIGERSGTYRLVGFTATYQHEKLSGDGSQPGYGVGVNFEQELTEKIAVFGRAFYHNEEVYNIPWAFSVGFSGTGLIPGREDDVIGVGSAYLVADDVVNTGGVETHLEAYYKISLFDHLFITPDLRYIIAPLGDSDNNSFLAAMVRAQLEF